MEIFHLTMGEKGASGSYPVRLQSTLGDGACTFVPPFDDAELEGLAKAQYAGGAGRSALERIGADLFRRVFVDEVGTRYSEGLVAAKRDGPLRIVLTLQPDELHQYPWELMNDGERFLAAAGYTQLVRRIGLTAPPTRHVSAPLRVLVAVSDPLDVMPDLDIRAELACIASALGTGEAYLEIQPAVRHVIQARLREEAFDVLHFSGHGAFALGEGCLCFEQENGCADALSALAFAALMEARSVPLVVLSACESGVASPQNVFAGVAHALVRSGVPAVVAMRSSLSDVGATDLVRDLYGTLRLDFDVVTALSEARRALYADRLDWHVPVLYTVHVDRKALEKASGTRETPVVPPFRLDLGLRPSVVFRLGFPVPVEFTKRVEQVPLGDALLASSPQVVSVHGPPGSGKTAIAGEMARRAAQQYRGGVLGLDCRTTNTLDAILVGINETLLEPWEAQVDLTQPWGRKALSSALGQRPFLIVLDNFESAMDEGDKELESIVGFLRDLPAPSKALVTSRERLDIGQRVHIDTLDRWPFALLLARAGKRRGIAGFDQDLCDRAQVVVGNPCRADEVLSPEERGIFDEAHMKLGGLPFAAEIFMGLLAEGESVVDLLNDLRAVHERMTDLLDLSFNRLSAGAKEMLVLMSIFSKPVKRDAVRAVCDRDDWEDSLEELIRTSLVSGNRYSLHPLVREYAVNKASDPRALRMAHVRAAEYFLAEDDMDPLAAIEHFYAAQSWPGVVRIANAFAEQLFRAGLWRQGCLGMEMAIDAARATGDRRGEVASLNHLGIFHRNLGEAQKAIGCYQQALDIAREIGDRRGEGSTLRNLANAYGVLGQLQKAIRHHKQALRIARETGDRRREGNSLGNLGNAYAETGDVKKAKGYYERSLEISRETGDWSAEANDLSNLGTAYAELDQAGIALECFRQALQLAVKAGDKRTESYSLGNLGGAYGALGEVRKAIEYYRQALVIAREIGDRPGEGVDLNNLGRVWSKQEEHELALACYLLAVEVGEAIGDPRVNSRQERIAELREELGEEEFARLLQRVEPNKERIVDDMLQAIARPSDQGVGQGTETGGSPFPGK